MTTLNEGNQLGQNPFEAAGLGVLEPAYTASDVRRIQLSAGRNDLTCLHGVMLIGVESGSAECQLWVGEKSTTGSLSRGTLFFTSNGEKFHIEVDRPCTAILLQLQNSTNGYGLPNWDRISGQVFRDRLIFETMLRVYDEHHAPIDVSSYLLDSAATLLVTSLTVLNARTKEKSSSLSKNAMKGLRKTVCWIEDNLAEHVTLKHLAKIAGLSEWHFLRQFKVKYHRSPHRYVQERRLAKAKELLMDSQLPISQISYACGFSSQSHMTTTFKQYFGVTPGDFRQEKRGNAPKTPENGSFAEV